MPSTYEKIKGCIEEDIQADAIGIEIHEAVAMILKKHEGKKFSKKIAFDLKEAFKDWKVYFKEDALMFSLIVGTPDMLVFASTIILLGYKDQDDVVNLETFEERDSCHGQAAVYRNEKRKEMLAGSYAEELAQAYDTYTEARAKFQYELGDSIKNPSYYSISYALEK